MSVKTRTQTNPKSLENLKLSQVKGVCHNPGGRPKGLAALVRENCQNGNELVKAMHSILTGELRLKKTFLDKDGNERVSVTTPDHGDIIESVKWFSDRGWGKSLEKTIDLTPEADWKAKAKEIAREMAHLNCPLSSPSEENKVS